VLNTTTIAAIPNHFIAFMPSLPVARWLTPSATIWATE